MSEYTFLTIWLIEAPREAVWDVLEDVETWPEWWPAVESTEQLEPGDAQRVGSRFRIRWRAPVGYALEFEFTVEESDSPRRMAGHATGELDGTGVWRLFEEGGTTAVTYEWNVRATKRWMNALGPLPRPLFRWSHDHVMAGGGEALAKRFA